MKLVSNTRGGWQVSHNCILHIRHPNDSLHDGSISALKSVILIHKGYCKILTHFINRRGGAMVIRIVYKDNVHDYVNDVLLGRFLDAGKIVKFQRRTGWVTVGIDPVRTGKLNAYKGAERRAARDNA